MTKRILLLCILICAALSLSACSFLFQGSAPEKEKVVETLAKVENVSYDVENGLLTFKPVPNAKSYEATVSYSPDYDVYSFGSLQPKKEYTEHLQCYDDEDTILASYVIPENTYGYTFVFSVCAYGYTTSDDTHVYEYLTGEGTTCEYKLSNRFDSTDNLAADVVELVERRLPLDLINVRLDYYEDEVPQRLLNVEFASDAENGQFCLSVMLATDGYDKWTVHDVINVTFRYDDALTLEDVRDDLGAYTQYEVSFPYNRNSAELPDIHFQYNYESSYEYICSLKYRSTSSKEDFLAAQASLAEYNAELIYGYVPINGRQGLQSREYYFRGIDAENTPVWYSLGIITNYLSSERITVVQDTTLTAFEPYQAAFMEQYYALRAAAAATTD